MSESRYCVYGLYLGDVLQYVGSTESLEQRRASHASRRLVPHDSFVVLARCNDRQSAFRSERRRIKKLQPPFNVLSSQRAPRYQRRKPAPLS